MRSVRPRVPRETEDRIRKALANGRGTHSTTRELGVGVSTVQRVVGDGFEGHMRRDWSVRIGEAARARGGGYSGEYQGRHLLRRRAVTRVA
jgi:hypothetical protein